LGHNATQHGMSQYIDGFVYSAIFIGCVFLYLTRQIRGGSGTADTAKVSSSK
jgi:hypothetical protein